MNHSHLTAKSNCMRNDANNAHSAYETAKNIRSIQVMYFEKTHSRLTRCVIRHHAKRYKRVEFPMDKDTEVWGTRQCLYIPVIPKLVVLIHIIIQHLLYLYIK